MLCCFSRMDTTMAKWEINISIGEKFKKHLDEGWLMDIAEKTLDAESVISPLELSITITDAETVQQLNRNYRDEDEATDVLAFPFSPQAAQGTECAFVTPPNGVLHLGEVIVSYPKAVEQALEQGHSTAREMALLVIHGILHLLGYDHEQPEQESKMRAREREILNKVLSDAE